MTRIRGVEKDIASSVNRRATKINEKNLIQKIADLWENENFKRKAEFIASKIAKENFKGGKMSVTRGIILSLYSYSPVTGFKKKVSFILFLPLPCALS